MTIADYSELLKWYDAQGRDLPWRSKNGISPDPYHVWLSEIMLQQTTVITVKDYFEKFIKRWPSIQDLANAPLDDILSAWAGLGYYARARNLHKCAKKIMTDFNGIFPTDAQTLKTLPGIGPYTSKAIAAIAFEQNEIALDGNVERVLTRLYADKTPIKDNKKRLTDLSKEIESSYRFGDYQQALMDLGATICTPTKPQCHSCPWQTSCRAYHQKIQDTLPTKSPKKLRPKKYTNAFITTKNNQILLIKRPEKGLLGGMLGVPTSDWILKETPPQNISSSRLPGQVKHIFTHFELSVTCYITKTKTNPITEDKNSAFYALDQIDTLALPTLMRKIIQHSQTAPGFS